MEDLRFSVAMCTYNGEKYIREQLDSIANQTISPSEIIICDDQSSDRTIEIINEFKKAVSFEVKLFINTNRLLSTKNFEKAINLCSGDIIVLSDQDDIWIPEKLEKILKLFIDEPNTSMVFSNAQLVDFKLENLGSTLWDNINFNNNKKIEYCSNSLSVHMKKNVVTGATMAFRSEFNDKIIPISEKWIHDEWIAFLLNTFTDTTFIDECLIKYRQHDNNQIGATKKSLVKIIKRGFNKRKFQSLEKEHEKYKDIYEHIKHLELKKGLQFNKGAKNQVEAKYDFLNLRKKNSNSNFIVRVLKIFCGLLNGSYFKYSSGYKSIMKDMFYN